MPDHPDHPGADEPHDGAGHSHAASHPDAAAYPGGPHDDHGGPALARREEPAGGPPPPPDPQPGPDPAPVPGVVPVAPDFWVELQAPGGGGAVLQQEAQLIANFLSQQFQSQPGSSNPRALAVMVRGAPDGRASTRIGVWMNGAGLPSPLAGQYGLTGMRSSLQAGESVAVSLRLGSIFQAARARWDRAPKWYDSNFNPNSNGNIQLKSWSMTPAPPSALNTQIKGTDDQPTPDVDFTINISEVFSVSGGQIASTVRGAVNADVSWLNYVTGALTNFWSLFTLGILSAGQGPGAGLTGLGGLLGASLIASAFGVVPTTQQLPSGVAGQVAVGVQNFFWNQFSVSGQNVNISYARAGVAGGWLSAGGAIAPIGLLVPDPRGPGINPVIDPTTS